MKSLHWGIIGPGNIAHDFARDLQLVQPPQKVTAVLGRTMENAETFAREFNAPNAFCDLQKFVEHPDIGIAYIATPHPQHFEQALACLQHGIPVLCEKPMTLNASQSAQLIDASQKNKCFLMEGMWLRFLPSIERVLSLISEARIGKVISVKATMGYKAPKDNSSRYFNPELGGGSLLDLGIYPVFLAHLLMGKPDTIKAVATLTEEGVDASCAVLLNYNNGGEAMLHSTLISQTDMPAEIAGENGLIRIYNPWFEKSTGIELQLYDKDKEVFPCEWEGHGLQFEVNEVLRCLQDRKIESDLFPHALSLQISETMDEVRKQVHVMYPAFE